MQSWPLRSNGLWDGANQKRMSNEWNAIMKESNDILMKMVAWSNPCAFLVFSAYFATFLQSHHTIARASLKRPYFRGRKTELFLCCLLAATEEARYHPEEPSAVVEEGSVNAKPCSDRCSLILQSKSWYTSAAEILTGTATLNTSPNWWSWWTRSLTSRCGIWIACNCYI